MVDPLSCFIETLKAVENRQKVSGISYSDDRAATDVGVSTWPAPSPTERPKRSPPSSKPNTPDSGPATRCRRRRSERGAKTVAGSAFLLPNIHDARLALVLGGAQDGRRMDWSGLYVSVLAAAGMAAGVGAGA